MSDLKERIDELAALVEEFHLAEAERTSDAWSVRLKKKSVAVLAAPAEVASAHPEASPSIPAFEEAPPAETKPAGIPINSPMTGIYYSAPSPTAPPFVRVGDVVEAGQVVGLIEAMKVFNEIVAPMSGTVTEMTAGNGQLVQPGEALLYVS